MTTDDQVFTVDACTLPTAERPLRLTGPAGLEARVRDLTARESQCCSFFTFTITPQPAAEDEAMNLRIEVPPAHMDVLDALVARASAR